jgi:hypothetical protein
MSEQVKVKDTINTDKKTIEESAKLSGKSEQEIIKGEDYVSPLQHPDKLNALIRDLEVPSQVRGHLSRGDKERWKSVVEQLLVRGIKSSRKIAAITGLTHVAANNYIKEIKDEWQSDLTPGKVNVRREQLYGENERIADFCWSMIQIDPLAREVPSYLKIIGETNTRRSRLVGAEQITLAVGQIETNHIDTNIIQTQAAAKLGVPVFALKELGETIAAKMILPLDEESSKDDDETNSETNSDSKDNNENNTPS